MKNPDLRADHLGFPLPSPREAALHAARRREGLSSVVDEDSLLQARAERLCSTIVTASAESKATSSERAVQVLGKPRLRFLRSPRWWIIGLAACLIVASVWWWPASDRAGRVEDPLASAALPAAPADEQATEAMIAAFCGDCHALPRPESFPRSRWHDAVRMGYKFYARSGRSDLEPPPIHQTVAYYRSRAPEQLSFSDAGAVDVEFRSGFRLEKLDWGRENYVLPAVSCLRWGPLESGERPVLLVCDMRDGSVSSLDLRSPARRRVTLAKFDHPCHVEPCDLDGDGRTDLVLAELGSFYPIDHDRGRVVWLQNRGAAESYSPVTLAEKLGRVADVQPADVDGDGDVDLVVAEFGHFRTGSILLLRNVTAAGDLPRFDSEQLDPRPGTTRVPVHDFDRDGQPDFLALVSQEYECLEVFINQGGGRFRLRNLWAGPDLTFGSATIDLADLDQDGDMDVLFANGDAFDNSYASPTHGIQWLENLGEVRFDYHRLVDFPGAYRALSIDIDLDGDLDVVTVAFLPPRVTPESLRSPSVASILVLEQSSAGDFLPHVLETGFACHATCEVGDFDADGDFDFVVGGFLFPHGVTGEDAPNVARLTVWWNERISTNRQ